LFAVWFPAPSCAAFGSDPPFACCALAIECETDGGFVMSCVRTDPCCPLRWIVGVCCWICSCPICLRFLVQPVILNNGNPAQGTRNCGHGPIARRVPVACPSRAGILGFRLYIHSSPQHQLQTLGPARPGPSWSLSAPACPCPSVPIPPHLLSCSAPFMSLTRYTMPPRKHAPRLWRPGAAGPFCERCMRATLRAGVAACPTCRREVTADQLVLDARVLPPASSGPSRVLE
jgi:hypothetical protein